MAVKEMVWLDIDELVPFQGDLKTLTEERYAALCQEIIERKFSYAFHAWGNAPDGKNYISDGHQRHRVLARMRSEGWRIPKMPVVLIDAVDETEFRMKLLSAVAQYGQVDRQGLYEFAELGGLPIEVVERYPLPELDMADFRAEFYDEDDTGKNGDGNDAPPAPAIPKTRVGDLWELGRHRLLCGSSLDPAHVARVMKTPLERADLVFTDPPYGVSYQKDMSAEEAEARNRRKDGKEVANDELTDEQLQAFLASAIRAWPLRPGGVFYMCAPAGRSEIFFRLALIDAGHALREAIVWAKDQFVFGRQDYHWRHESILYGWREGAAHYFIDDRTQDTVWEIPRPKRSEEHPTMKPVELVERALRNSTLRDQVVFDGFAGSGTTLIAAEGTGRQARVIELMPAYCDVVLQRYRDLTGTDPVRQDGVKWSEIRA